MLELLTIENIANLGVLIFLQAVLGFDNLLYISIESQRAPEAQRASVRRFGIILAVVLRVVLLFVMMRLISALTEPFLHLNWQGVVEGAFQLASLEYAGQLNGEATYELSLQSAGILAFTPVV